MTIIYRTNKGLGFFLVCIVLFLCILMSLWLTCGGHLLDTDVLQVYIASVSSNMIKLNQNLRVIDLS